MFPINSRYGCCPDLSPRPLAGCPAWVGRASTSKAAGLKGASRRGARLAQGEGIEAQASPPARGWARMVARAAFCATGFPARVGMSRRCCRHLAGVPGIPALRGVGMKAAAETAGGETSGSGNAALAALVDARADAVRTTRALENRET